MGKKGLTPPNFEDLTGKIFGRLTVIKKVQNKKSNTTMWECKCECGKIIQTNRSSLIKGHSKSCGCLARELASIRSKKFNNYDLSGDYGIGYASNTKKQFYFDTEDYSKIKDYCWYEGKNGYIATRCNINKKIILLHSMILNPTHTTIDHINRNKIDNRKQNLRLVTKQQNSINKSKQSNNKSGIVGVYYDKSRGKWVGSLTFGGKKYFERFDNISEAIEYRNKLEKTYFGEYAPAGGDCHRRTQDVRKDYY